MNKNNKRKSAVTAIALTLLVGAGSLAYFTDQKLGEVQATAANVSLEQPTNITDDSLLVPGDSLSLNQLNPIKYTGNVNARYRVIAKFDIMEAANLAYNTETDEPGFHLIDGKGVAVELGEKNSIGYLIDDGVINYNSEGENNIILGGEGGYKLHLNEATGNDSQDKPLGITIGIQVLQEGNTNEDWTTISNEVIEINPK